MQTFMAMVGVLPPEEPGYVRVDAAVDVRFGDPLEGWRLLEALKYARWPEPLACRVSGASAVHNGCGEERNEDHWSRVLPEYQASKRRPSVGEKIRLEREQRFAWKDRRDVGELEAARTAAAFWGAAFGHGGPAGRVTRIERELQTVKLAERVQLGEITASQFEQLTGFLAERLGLTDRIYKPETARRRRALARELGVSANDAVTEPLDESLDELLTVPRSAWAP
jgi:hypothetical protein